MTTTFTLNCIPPTATSQQKGAFALPRGGVRFFKKKPIKQAENMLLVLLQEHRPAVPHEGPVRLAVHFRWPFRKGESKKVRESGMKWKTTKPDCSNVVKLLEDCMTALGFWNDDSQVAWLEVTKTWAPDPGITVSISTL